MANLNSAMQPVQAKVFSVLTGDSALQAAPVSGHIYDEVPPSYDNFPYIQLGATSETIDNTFSTTGRLVTQDIHIYSNARGWLESQTILESLVRLLDETTLVTIDANWTGSESYYSAGQEIREPDGVRHITARFTFRVERAGH